MSTAESIRIYPGAGGFPLDPQAVFGRSGPLVVEVGFGNATFLAGLAREHPDWNFIGVEIASVSLSRGIGRARREGLDNVRLLCADARVLVTDMLPERSIHRVYVNFPDPWPKDKHVDRRLLADEFFRVLSTRLVDGGELWLTTDHAGYYEYSVDEGKGTQLYEVLPGDPPPSTLETKYAQRWQSQGIKINHAVFRLRERDPAPHPVRLEVVEVTHARLKGDLGIVTEFEKQVHEFDGGHVVLLDCTRSLDGERLHVECIVDEADLRQELLVEVRNAPGGIYVELQHFGRPAITRGVKKAVDLVADWLSGLGMEKIEGAV